jgi:hypothetical protein
MQCSITKFVGLPEPGRTLSKSNGKIRPNIRADNTEYLMDGQHPCSLRNWDLTYLRSHFFAPSRPRPMDSGSDDVADQSIEENLDLRQVLPSPQEDIPQ